MGEYVGPKRQERTDEATVEFLARGPGGGTFTIYLEPGEELALSENEANHVEVRALEVDDE